MIGGCTTSTSINTAETTPKSNKQTTTQTTNYISGISFDGEDLTETYDNAKQISLNGNSASSEGNVTINHSTVTITQGGVYVLSGELSDGQIMVNSSDNNTVHIILNGVSIILTHQPLFIFNLPKKLLLRQ